MLVAIVLVATEANAQEKVLKEILKVKNVKKAFACFGRWDIVVRLEAPTIKDLNESSLEINGMKGVRATETLLATT